MGYILTNVGSAERFMPFVEEVKINAVTSVRREHVKPMPVSLWELNIP